MLEQIIDDNNLNPWKWKIFLEYEDYFFKFLNFDRVRLLEIGVFKGESLKVWNHYFAKVPQRLIVGIDTKIKAINTDTIKTYVGTQTDTAFLTGIVKKHGTFDIIIDDGSHVNNDQISTFEHMYQYLNDGGIYIVEDIYSSYHLRWLNKISDKNITFVNHMKKKVDDLNAYWSTDENWPPKGELFDFEKTTKSVNFHDSFLVVQKKTTPLLKHELIRGTV